jgi:hypothetical protein
MLLYCTGVERKLQRLKPGVIPSIFNWSKKTTEQGNARKQRAERRATCRTYAKNVSGATELPIELLYDGTDTVEEVVLACNIHTMSSTRQNVTLVNSSTQTEAFTESCASQNETTVRPEEPYITEETSFLSFANLQKDIELLHYYTGLETPMKLVTVFETLGPAVNHLNYYTGKVIKTPSPLNQFILMLAKLRQDLDYLPLSKMFGISIGTSRIIFITWINFCSRQWGEINVWPSGALVKYFAPKDFLQKFPSVRVIVDCTELPIQKPSDPVVQRATFSTYKNRNTVKVMVGISPGALITYLSPAYGGSASDRQIVERSGLVYMCDPKDSIMAYKGFNVQDLFALNDVTVNIPSFFKQKKTE